MHSKIKVFLDTSSASGDTPIADSNRFLPRKMPQSGNLSDLQLIKAASSLMVELENGKLSSTIRNFCKRAALESSEKYVYELRKSGGEGRSSPSHRESAPQWGKWLQEDRFKEVSQKLSHDLQVANQIYNIEKGVSGEVGRLRELGVYPTAELALIRRQFKLLEREWEGSAGSPSPENSNDAAPPRQEAELELEFVERKRQLLRHRRMEVESDLVLVGGATARETQAQQKDRMFFGAEPSRAHMQGKKDDTVNNSRHSKSTSSPSHHSSRKEASAEAVLRHHPAHRALNQPDISPYLAIERDTQRKNKQFQFL